MKKLKRKLKNLPSKPGVYYFKSGKEIIYVGKAKNLKKRISSYFQKNTFSHKPEMIDKITDFDYIITSSEKEAILLEANLIKKYKPKFNVILKDDKNFTYIKITDEDFPQITLTRQKINDKAKYFGPYLSANSAKNILNIIRKIFPFRTCRRMPKRPCLLYHLNYCPAPCIGKIGKNKYKKNIEKIIRLLKGNFREIIKELKKEMDANAQRQKYEKAAELRDKIFLLEEASNQQKIFYLQDIDQDILSLVKNKESAINIFSIREGKINQKKTFILKNTENIPKKEIYSSFIKQYYRDNPDKPKEVILSQKINGQKLLEKVFQFKIKITKKGKKFQLFKLGELNAKEYLKQNQQIKEKEIAINKTLEELKKKLYLKKIPKRIEAYDISNIQGVNPVGGMIVFEKGKPKKSDYRKFNIKYVKGINDTAMIAEALERRLKNKDWALPDLIILDGGKGQLNAGLKVLEKLKIKIPIISIAKKMEKIFLRGQKHPLLIPQNSPLLYLIQNIRNEAHRFAIGSFHKRHQKESYHSFLDEIPGIGPKTKKKILSYFGSLSALKKAPFKEIKRIMGKKKANILKKYL